MHLQTKNPNFQKIIVFLGLTGFDCLSVRQEQHANKNYSGAFVGWYRKEKTELLWLKPVPVPMYPSQVSQRLDRDGTGISVATGRRITTYCGYAAAYCKSN